MKKMLSVAALFVMMSFPAVAQDMMSTSTLVTTTMLVSAATPDDTNSQAAPVMRVTAQPASPATPVTPANRFMQYLVGAFTLVMMAGMVWALLASMFG